MTVRTNYTVTLRKKAINYFKWFHLSTQARFLLSNAMFTIWVVSDEFLQQN